MKKMMVLAVLSTWLWLGASEVMAGGGGSVNYGWRGRMDYCAGQYKTNSDGDFKNYICCLWSGGQNRQQTSTVTSPKTSGPRGISQTALNGMSNKGCDPGSAWSFSGYWSCWPDGSQNRSGGTQVDP